MALTCLKASFFFCLIPTLDILDRADSQGHLDILRDLDYSYISFVWRDVGIAKVSVILIEKYINCRC